MAELGRQLLTAVWKIRAAVASALAQIPFWPDIVRAAARVCSPVVGLAQATLRALPIVRRAEWLLEIESLTRRHPVPLALALLYVAWRGLHPTHLGHIGTDRIIYPFLGAVSGFNPFLGLVCAAVFGAADLVQKLFWPDIYGARGWGDVNYWAALGGYAVAYSSVAWIGVFPGMLARVFRVVVVSVVRAFFSRRAAASADGAVPGNAVTLAQVLDPATGVYRLDLDDAHVLEVVHALASDPRDLISDVDALRRYPLTVEQAAVLEDLQMRGMVGPRGRASIQPLLDRFAQIQAQQAAHLARLNPPRMGAYIPDPWAGAFKDGYSPLVDVFATLAGGGLGAYLTMTMVAPRAETPAFHWRPSPDFSCKRLEDQILASQAGSAATASGLGAAAAALAPAGGAGAAAAAAAAVPGGPGEGEAAPPGGPSEDDVERATNLQNEINERQAEVDRLQRDIDAFRSTHGWDPHLDDRVREMQQDLADEQRMLADARTRFNDLGVQPDAEGVHTYEYATHYSATDRDNLLHAIDAGEVDGRREAAIHFNNLRAMLSRIERDDRGDLGNLMRDGQALSTQVAELLTEFGISPWVTPDDLRSRDTFLRHLRERVEDAGYVTDAGLFYGNHGGERRDMSTVEGRLGDVSESLGQVDRLVRSQRGEAPVSYGAGDAWVDAEAAVTNAMSLGTGAEVAQALDSGGSATDVVRAFSHGLLNTVTAGGLSGAEQGWEDYWARGPHDGSVTDYLGGLVHAGGTGLAHTAGNTVLPVEAMGVLLGPESTGGQRVGALVQVLGGAATGANVTIGLSNRVLGSGPKPAPPPLSGDAVGQYDPLRYMPDDPVQRGTYVRNLLRDKGIREDLVRRVGYDPNPPATKGRVRYGQTFPGEEPTASVYPQAFEDGRTSVESTALHEVDHVLQLEQRKILAAPGGPLEGRVVDGTPAPAENVAMETEVRMYELDRNLRDRNNVLRRAGINQDTVPFSEWPDEARAAQREVWGAQRALGRLLEMDKQAREITVKIHLDDLQTE
jgi:hypothetical protein